VRQQLHEVHRLTAEHVLVAGEMVTTPSSMSAAETRRAAVGSVWVLRGVPEKADDGTRTHDLLHGKQTL
jgi:hypothetical protein